MAHISHTNHPFKVCTIQWLLVYSQVSILNIFIPKRNHMSFSCQPTISLHLSLPLSYVTMKSLAASSSSFRLLLECNCMMCGLSLLSIMLSVLVQVVAGVSTSFFLYGEHSSTHFVCPILYWWTLWDFYLCIFMNSYAIKFFVCVDIFFYFSWVYT